MEPGDIATWAGILITLVISLLARRDTKRQAEIAEEANIASQAQVEAAQRRAIAVEDSLTEALRLLAESQPAAHPPDPAPSRPAEPDAVRWTLERRGKQSYLLRNVGTVTASGVHIDRDRTTPIVRNLPESATVRPGESVQFLMAPTFGNPLPGEVWVEWDGHSEPEAVPLPG